MGKIVAVVGNTGAGKTTLVRALCRQREFNLGLEQHTERPFQELFKNDPRYALANQVDYLLQRAKQEVFLREQSGYGLIDGGLDLDYYGFTHLFHSKGFLTNEEFSLCKDLYQFCRSFLPGPDLFIHLKVDIKTLSTRLSRRVRINIAQPPDLELFDSFLNSWLERIPQDKILSIEASDEDKNFIRIIPIILDKLDSLNIKY